MNKCLDRFIVKNDRWLDKWMAGYVCNYSFLDF